MHVMEWGTGMPVLMLKRQPHWGFLYRKSYRFSGHALRCIAPDIIGLGFSGKLGHS
jgi:haloalkane dehalogenase